MPSDQLLMDYVQRAVATGKTTIKVPAELFTNASKEALAEMKSYCKLCGVKIIVRD